MKAISIVDGVATIDYSKCKKCGKCIRSCKFDAIVEEEAEKILVKSMKYYNKYGREKERFGDMLDRVGLEKSIDKITSEIGKDNI